MKTITKEFQFDAAHKLYNPEWSNAKNKKVFGKCSGLHGHTYKLFITIGNLNEQNGMIMNFVKLKEIVNRTIIERFDHKYLNDDPLYKDGRLSTCENQVEDIWEILLDELVGNGTSVFLEEIKLYETPTSFCTYTGPFSD